MPRAHILVVDDEVAILNTLRKALSVEGHSVDVAGGIRVAEERLSRGMYDLVLLDVALPDGDGVDLLGRLRSGGNDVAAVMMSGHGTIDAAVRATRLGALDFLEKPISTDRLLVVIENTLRLLRAEAEAESLRAEAGHTAELLGDGPAMRALRDQILRAARSNVTVLVTGERGTGKELVARAIHRASPRSRGPLEKLNCAAVPADLIESELFGHEAGAFTGATRQRRGKFERASGGTIFLDEVGDRPLGMQAKLLRVLQESEIERVGGSETLRVDVRVVAATNKDLGAACAAGAFRADLYDRIAVLPLSIPPLRVRRDDVPVLAQHFLGLAARASGRPGLGLSDGAMRALMGFSFPGNVRELRNVVERLAILAPADVLEAADVERALGMGASPGGVGLYRPGVPFRVLADEAERKILEEALTHHGGQMAAAARALDLERSHLYKKARALGLRPGKGDED